MVAAAAVVWPIIVRMDKIENKIKQFRHLIEM